MRSFSAAALLRAHCASGEATGARSVARPRRLCALRRLAAVVLRDPDNARLRSCRRRLAFSSSRRRAVERLRPARLMKNWIMRTPEPGPFGLTERRGMVRAIVAASLVKRPFGGRVETVLTFPLHRLRLFFSTMGSWTCIGHARPVRARVACYILVHPRCRSAASVRRRSTSVPTRAVRAARPSAPREHTGARQGDDGTDGGACNGGRQGSRGRPPT